ncbi:sigma factor regulatory protein, FecR/PupR family [Leptospira yanagawae serovar Saopaulo str. Sao Paulo = ATCC 700523]|uniref:Sigma factor regulatory protein, FecR/PupR family n=1 Tax=Leptospira yanagawae serovar Saopaulo str. Sao Paulo = ATCC 700523 TaxID=1249483 RepID=A0A5E8HD26_9LEPT|nr:FecR domain-containing protein [Leptospira yanagawae]EOQ88772.1 sigma factor regulatory protein, FecR/PupR family [Leptospira yanagawae serovar Saopaulo str. Sao Paulo = ATCC 700523]
MNLDKRDSFVLIGLTSIAIFFSVLFYLDLNRKIDIGDREVVGTIFFKNNIVQRKFEDEVIWEKLENNSPLINKDTIRSEAFSDAIIRLKDGTEINIDENSMFNLDLTGDEPNLEFSEGSLEVKKNDSNANQIKITSSGNEINVDSGNVKIQKAKDQELSLFVEKGKTTVKQNGKTVSVDQGKKAEFKTSGIEIKKIPIVLLSPASQKLFYTDPTEALVNFTWKVESGYESPILEISRSPNFQMTFFSEQVNGNQTTVSLKEGTFYWRVKVKNKNGKETSETNKLFVSKLEPFLAESPNPGTVIPFVQTYPLVTISWSKLTTANTYQLLLSDSNQFQNPTKRIETSANQISLDDLKEGTYYWKVIAKSSFPDTKDRETKVYTFVIKKGNQVPAPKWQRPMPETEITLDDIKQNQAILIWEGNAEIHSYTVLIAKDPKFTNLVVNAETTSNYLVPNWNGLGLGTFFAKVIGKTKEGKETERSQTLSFSVIDKKKKIEVVTNAEDSKPQSNQEPKLESMSPNGAMIQMKGKSSLDFQWKVSGLVPDRYDIVLYQHLPDKKIAIYKVSTKDSYYHLKDLSILDEGSFSWDLSVYKNSNLLLSRKGTFILALDQLKSLKPSDIEFISPKRLYKEKK